MAIPTASPGSLASAMDRFDAEHRGKGRWKDWPAKLGKHAYAIVREGYPAPYPVKMTISLATGVPVTSFFGGKGFGNANSYALDIGLSVIDLRTGIALTRQSGTQIRDALERIGKEYLSAREETYEKHPLARFIRKAGPEQIAETIKLKNLKFKGGCGQAGNWAFIPWIGIFDLSVTDGAQYGYYLVYLFSADMKRVYLSMNQGTTEVRQEAEGDAESLETLRLQAKLIRDRISEYDTQFEAMPIDLASKRFYARGYEAGHAYGCEYAIDNLPTEQELRDDLLEAIRLYRILILRGGTSTLSEEDAADVGLEKATIPERRAYVAHRKLERNPKASREAKRIHGYVCQCCGFDFGKVYGDAAAGYIEAHHKIPLSTIPEGETVELDPEKDFAVLCGNCHAAIHRKGMAKTVEELQTLPGVATLRKAISGTE